jgi:cation:H+ antiporter
MFLDLLGIHGFGLYLLEFAIAAVVVLFVSSKLAIYADKLAGESKLTSSWIGFIVLASITSLPELFVGVSSTGIVGSPGLIASDAIGSSAFNVVTLAVMLLVARKALVNLKIEDTLTAFAGIALMTLAGAFVASNVFVTVTPALSIVYSVVIVLSVCGIVFVAFKSGGLKEEDLDDDKDPGKGIVWKFILFAVVIFGTSIWLTKTADLLASTPFAAGGRTVALGQTLIGARLLAIATPSKN